MYVHCIQFLGCFAIRNHVQPMQGNPRRSWILDSTSWILDFQVVDFSLCRWNLDLDCNCRWDSEFLDLYSGFQSPGYGIPQENFSQILDPKSKTLLDSGIRNPLHQATSSLFPAFTSCGVWPEIRERETITKKKELRERESSHPLPYPLAVFFCSHSLVLS